MSAQILFRHGPFSFFASNMAAMPEGQPYAAAVLDSRGNALTLLYVGGHDGQNKLLGGGFQVFASDFTSVIAPQGAALVDGATNLWISTGSGWKPVSGNSSFTSIDCGSYW